MTKLLEDAVEELRTLPEDEQDRAAQALLAFARDRHDNDDDEQIAGIHHAMGQADGGEFVSDGAMRTIFSRAI
jgi:phage-related protein